MAPPYRIMIVENQPIVGSLLSEAADQRFALKPIGNADIASAALGEQKFHAVIIDMAISDADPLLLAELAAAHGCGTILMPDLPVQFHAAARAGHFILCKPPRAERVFELIEQACAAASMFSSERRLPS